MKFILLVILMLTPPVNVLDVILDARNDNQPVLPDDLGEKAAGVWVTPEPVIEDAEVMPSVTLFTAEGKWCGPCNSLAMRLGLDKKKRTVTADLPFALNLVFIPAEGNSPTGSVPCMQIEGTSVRLKGSTSLAALVAWYNKNAKAVTASKSVPADYEVVEVTGWDHDRGQGAARALTAHIERQTADSPAVGGIFDPVIKVDVDEEIVSFLNALTTTGAKLGPATITWPKGVVSFDPPLTMKIKKIITFNAALKLVEFNGDEITFRTDGLINLTVRFK